MRYTDYFRYQVQARPDLPCLRDADRELTYAEADRESDRFVAALAHLEPQTRVAVVSDNCVDFVLLDLATTKLNLVLVPLNTRLHPGEWAHILDHSEAAVVFAGEAHCDGLEKVRDELSGVATWVSLTERASWTDLEAFLAAADPAGPPAVPSQVRDEDVELQLYTSGTTGLPKGVLHTHRSMTMSTMQWAQLVEPWDGLRGRTLLAAPLFHGAPLIMARTTLCWGGLVETHPRFDPDAMLDAAAAQPIAWTMMVPSMIHMCVERARSRPQQDYQFGVVTYGGSPIAESVLREAIGYLGTGFLQIYGLTEALLSTSLSPADHARALAGEPHLLRSAGRPIAGVSLRIEEVGAAAVGGASTASTAATAEPVQGEVVITSPNPMLGYSKNPEATAAMMRDGVLYSGDAGYLDAEGYLYICDRVKDMIVTGGENVFSTEVEDVLHAHPAVADVAVIGTPHPRWGEVVTAFIVAAHGEGVVPEEVTEFCRKRIAPYKVPRVVEVVPELPRNSMGKLLKGKLREAYWDGRDRRV